MHNQRRLVAVGGLVAAIVVVWLLAGSVFGGADTEGSQVLRYSIVSPRVHQTLAQLAVIPPGTSARRRPLLVYLHGKGGDAATNLSSQLFSALHQLGPRAPDIVFPDGGEDSYWHDRSDGAWGKYVMREVILQALRRLQADPRRVAIGGLSMGGFGAYDLARLNPRRFCAVGADSAALWRSGGESAAGAFDSAEDFSHHDVIGSAVASSDPFPGAKLWVDVGTADPFKSADTEFAQDLKAKGSSVELHVWPGGHDTAYWRSHWRDYLRFYSRALDHCG
jgi:S-formylglutathione hydrolase FrmB